VLAGVGRFSDCGTAAEIADGAKLGGKAARMETGKRHSGTDLLFICQGTPPRIYPAIVDIFLAQAARLSFYGTGEFLTERFIFLQYSKLRRPFLNSSSAISASNAREPFASRSIINAAFA